MTPEEVLLEQRIIRLDGEVNQDSTRRIIMQLLYLQIRSREPATLVINSDGGIVDDGLAIYDVIRFLTLPVWTHCERRALGIASLILASGAAGNRTATDAIEVGLIDRVI